MSATRDGTVMINLSHYAITRRVKTIDHWSLMKITGEQITNSTRNIQAIGLITCVFWINRHVVDLKDVWLTWNENQLNWTISQSREQ